MKIQPVTMENFSQAAQIYTASWRASHRDVCSREFLQKRDCAAYLRDRIKGLYLISGEKPVGVFRVWDNTLSDLYIHPEQTGKGYGTACVGYAQKMTGVLRLTVLSSNEKAIRLYEKTGFRFTGRDVPLLNGLIEREMQYTEKNQ